MSKFFDEMIAPPRRGAATSIDRRPAYLHCDLVLDHWNVEPDGPHWRPFAVTEHPPLTSRPALVVRTTWGEGCGLSRRGRLPLDFCPEANAAAREVIIDRLTAALAAMRAEDCGAALAPIVAAARMLDCQVVPSASITELRGFIHRYAHRAGLKVMNARAAQ